MPPMSTCILIIDDNDDIVKLLERVLQRTGYHTVGHTDHATAYERIREVHPELILTDLMAGPTLAGWHTLMAASLDPETCAIPAILMSSNTGFLSFLSKNQTYLTERGYSTLEKPFTLEQLVATVVAAIGMAT